MTPVAAGEVGDEPQRPGADGSRRGFTGDVVGDGVGPRHGRGVLVGGPDLHAEDDAGEAEEDHASHGLVLHALARVRRGHAQQPGPGAPSEPGP